MKNSEKECLINMALLGTRTILFFCKWMMVFIIATIVFKLVQGG